MPKVLKILLTFSESNSKNITTLSRRLLRILQNKCWVRKFYFFKHLHLLDSVALLKIQTVKHGSASHNKVIWTSWRNKFEGMCLCQRVISIFCNSNPSHTMETRENLKSTSIGNRLVKSYKIMRQTKRMTGTVLSLLSNCSDWSKSRVFLFSIPSFKTFQSVA